jgi:PAS domain S-box-containing protein
MDGIESLQQELERERLALRETQELLQEKSRELEELRNSVETEIKRRCDEHSRQEKAYRELVETVSDIIYRSDEKGYFIYVNPGAVAITGFSEQELIGSHYTQLIRPDYRERMVRYYMNQLRGRIQSTYAEFPIVTKSGAEMWIGQTVDLHTSEDGHVQFIAMCRDISDRKKAETALIRSEEKFRRIIEDLELGLLEVNNMGIIVKAYPQFCKLTGYTPDELQGRIADDILLTSEGKKTMERELQKRHKGQSSVYEAEIIHKNGHPIWVIISGAPFYNEKNEIAGTVGIHLDITARKKMEEELRYAKEIAEKSLRSKDLFVANMSHEIRTPMNAIIGMSQLLKDSGLTDKQREYVGAIKTSSDNLLTIVNDLLDFSKIEAGKMELELIPGDLAKTIATTAQLLELKIDEKGLILEKHVDERLAPQYLFDPTRLGGVLTNLLHNAIKFTSNGKITFTVSVVEQNEKNDRILFKVEDTGIGIPEDKLNRIFDSFVQAESSTTRKYGGTGLGLSISKELVQLMGGELEVESEVGKGSAFSFQLQLTKSNEQIDTPQETYDEAEIAGLRILLVEDNQINRFMAQTILEQWKVEVTAAENGAVALDLMQDNTFDLVLMDMQMPVLDGLQTTWMIRNKLEMDIPIVALTANAVKGEAEKCLQAGMNGFVSKPFRQEDLLCTIVQVLHQTWTSAYPQEETTETGTSAGQLTDLSLLYRNTNNDQQFMHKMLQLVIKETERKVNEIERLLTEKDAENVRHVVHSMKPSIDHVAASSVRELLREVESGMESYDLFEAKTRKLLSMLKLLAEELKSIEL